MASDSIPEVELTGDQLILLKEGSGPDVSKIRNSVPESMSPGFHYFAPTNEDTEWVGYVIQQTFNKPGSVILLSGEIGAGKTSIARGFIRSFCNDPLMSVASPSYLLNLVYEDDSAIKSHDTPRKIHHMDPYRLKVADKMAGVIDFDEALEKDICLIEWPNKMPSSIQERFVKGIRIHVGGIGIQAAGRQIAIQGIDAESAAVLSEWRVLGDFPSSFQESFERRFRERIEQVEKTSGPLVQTGIPPAKPRKEWMVLGIESSCDDTGAAIVRGDGKIISHKLASQAGLHEQFGGVKPDVARAAHAAAIQNTVDTCIAEAGIDPAKLDAIAVTVGPGLALCLQVGVRHAYQLAAKHQIPIVPVHHMEAHALVTRLPDQKLFEQEADRVLDEDVKTSVEFPALILLVSGGHNLLVFSEGVGRHRLIGVALDDSVGECFDKSARAMGIDRVPGGPWLEKLATRGHAGNATSKFVLPVPLQGNRNHMHSCNFSFSGLKTAVGQMVTKLRKSLNLPASPPVMDVSAICAADKAGVYIYNNEPAVMKEIENLAAEAAAEVKGEEIMDDQQDDRVEESEVIRELKYLQGCADLSLSFQKMVVKVLCHRTERALSWLADDFESGKCGTVKSLVVAGGVAANSAVREGLKDVAMRNGITFNCPPMWLCMDNGVMVAWAGVERLALGLTKRPLASAELVDESAVEVISRWPLGPTDPRGAYVIKK